MSKCFTNCFWQGWDALHARSSFSSHFSRKRYIRIGVAISDTSDGSCTDLHPAGPILSPEDLAPGNTIQMIDPTVPIDADEKIYVYHVTFGCLRTRSRYDHA
ncbi:Beta-hexosaminidase [Venturia inaequalis]|nr:Beta-hexosaminidase [Venturia inaequalis]